MDLDKKSRVTSCAAASFFLLFTFDREEEEEKVQSLGQSVASALRRLEDKGESGGPLRSSSIAIQILLAWRALAICILAS